PEAGGRCRVIRGTDRRSTGGEGRPEELMLKRLLRRLRRPPPGPRAIKVPIATLGTEYGSQTVCDSVLKPGAIVYSFGVGEDASFDLELIRQFDCEVYAFDPTPRSIAWV